MSRLVTSSPTSGATTSRPAASSSGRTASQRTNSSSYFTEPSPLSSTATRDPPSAGASSQDPADQLGGQLVGRGQLALADAGLAVDAEARRWSRRAG